MTICCAAIFAPRGNHRLATLCLLGIGFGWPLGGPGVAQAWPKGHPSVAQGWICGSAFVCNKKAKKAGWGRNRRHRRPKAHRGGAETRRTAKDRERQDPTTDSTGMTLIGEEKKSGHAMIGEPETESNGRFPGSAFPSRPRTFSVTTISPSAS
jgi:hypothetical protein